MTDLILHHYPESPFSEKVRLLLGYKKLSYCAVTIPAIMPKPDLMSLTGGYRKTPVLQIGADIYCDTALICKVIERLAPEPGIYPAQSGAVASMASQWTDSVFFRTSVTVAFQPRAIATNPLFQDPDAAAAFVADRAKLTEGAGSLIGDLDIAQAEFTCHLKRLDRQLELAPFLLGDMPTIVDFSTYHCCWFVHNNEVIRDVFSPFTQVLNWFERMSGFGHGQLTTIEASIALEQAESATASIENKATTSAIDQLKVGDRVQVVPTDYGFQPVAGTLLLSSLEEIVVSRTDERVGEVAVHFPRMGFQVTKLD